MRLDPEIARDLRCRTFGVYHIEGEYIGVRKVSRIWFNPASGHYVADAAGSFMWSDGPDGPWHCVPSSVSSRAKETKP